MTKVKTKDGKQLLISDALAKKLVKTGDVVIVKEESHKQEVIWRNADAWIVSYYFMERVQI